MAYGSWREADTGYIIGSDDAYAYCPDGVGVYYVDTLAELREYEPCKIVRVGANTWDEFYY